MWLSYDPPLTRTSLQASRYSYRIWTRTILTGPLLPTSATPTPYYMERKAMRRPRSSFTTAAPPHTESFSVSFPYIVRILANPPLQETSLFELYSLHVLGQGNQLAALTYSAAYKVNATFLGNKTQCQNMSLAQVARGQPNHQVQERKHVPVQQHEPAPAYITSFVRECFTEDLCEVDFTQAITSLEYLRILEDKRRRELAAAVKRLSIDPAVLERDREGLQNSHPGIFEWIASTEAKSKKVEALYTQVYIGLRRWVCYSELPRSAHANWVEDFDQRDAPDTFQQAKLHCHAEHSISSKLWLAADQPIDRECSECATQCLLPIHPSCGEEWQGGPRQSRER